MEADDRGDQEGSEGDGPPPGRSSRGRLCSGAVRQQQVGGAVRLPRPGSQRLSSGGVRDPAASDEALAQEEEIAVTACTLHAIDAAVGSHGGGSSRIFSAPRVVCSG